MHRWASKHTLSPPLAAAGGAQLHRLPLLQRPAPVRRAARPRHHGAVLSCRAVRGAEGHPRAFSEPILGAARRRGVRLCHQRQAPGCIRNDMVRAMPSVSRSWQDPQTLTFLGPCYARFAQFSAFRCARRGDRLPGCLAPTHPPHPLLQPRLRHVGARRIMHRHQPLPQDLQVAPATLSALGEPMRGGSGRSKSRGPTPRS